MKAKRPSKKTLFALVAATIATFVWAGIFVQKTRRPHHPTDGIPFYFERYQDELGNGTPNVIAQLERLLVTTVIANIDFRGLRFEEAMENLFAKINDGRPVEDHVRCTYSENITNENMDAPITLQLSNVSAVEGLRYTTSLAQVKYAVLDGNEVVIMGLSEYDSTLHTAKFQVLIPLTSDTGPGPFDVTAELTRAGVSFHEDGYADYYPDENIVVVAATEDQMELVDAYFSSVCIIYKPTLLEKVRDSIGEFFHPTPTPPPVPATPPLPVDPFATPPSTSTSNPDPFDPAGSTPSEPDPFAPKGK